LSVHTLGPQCATDTRIAVPSQPGEAAATESQSGRPSPFSRYYAKHLSHDLAADPPGRVFRRSCRYIRREVLWHESALPRVRKCGRVRASVDDIGMRDNAGVWHYTGLATCGSIWACPVCSAKIRHVRAREISEAAARWHDAGNTVVMVTLTFPHHQGLALARTFPVLAAGFGHLISGEAWAGRPERYVPPRPSKRGGMLPGRVYPARIGLRDRTCVAGTIRSIEITYGANGWHPHAHALFFLRGRDMRNVAILGGELQKRWRAWVVGQGFPAPSAIHGVDVRLCESAAEAGEYIAKTQDGRAVGNEMTRADLKSGRAGSRTPFEILDYFRHTGDKAALDLWNEYERITKGRQCITWSKGLHQLLAADDRTDEEIAAEEVGGTTVADIRPGAWAEITSVPGFAVHLLELGESGGVIAVNAELRRRGITPVRCIDRGARHDPGECPLCDSEHELCRFTAGSLDCVNDPCGNPHHRAREVEGRDRLTCGNVTP
jgi:hypothetical protein